MGILTIIAFIIGAGDGPLWPSLLALVYIIYQLGIKEERREQHAKK